MSYNCENAIPKSVQKKDIVRLIELLNYKPVVTWMTEDGQLEEYNWFESHDYKSWGGIELDLSDDDDFLRISTKTSIGRSYYDLQHQNETARTIRRIFGGSVTTSEARNGFLHPQSGPPSPPQSGCHLAFQRFGSNLINAVGFFERKTTVVDQTNRELSNNLLLPYLVSIIEEFFRSTFVALLSYSKQKESFFKNARLGAALLPVAAGESSVEEVLAQSLSFQSVAALCRHFHELDRRIDFAAILRKPYRRRKNNLFSSWESLIVRRHDFVHRSKVDASLNDRLMHSFLEEIEVGVCRCYKHLTGTYKWPYGKFWAIGRRAKPPLPQRTKVKITRRGKVPRISFVD